MKEMDRDFKKLFLSLPSPLSLLISSVIRIFSKTEKAAKLLTAFEIQTSILHLLREKRVADVKDVVVKARVFDAAVAVRDMVILVADR